MQAKSTPHSRVDEAVAKSVDFELTVVDIARRSERRAWRVAFGAMAVMLLLAGGYYYMLPLKQKVPYLVMADAYTGTATVVGMHESAVRNITAHDAINRSNVAHFILARESYDVTMMKLRDWVTVLTMSAPSVAAAYRALYSPNNEGNPYKVYAKERAIRVNILSIVLLGNAPGHVPTGATVRFQRSVFDKTSGGTLPLDNKIATLVFTYKPNLQMDERYRIANPLGFQVTDYRVSTDYATTPPDAVPALAPSGSRDGMRQARSPSAAAPGIASTSSARGSWVPASTPNPAPPEWPAVDSHPTTDDPTPGAGR